ncbi:DNA/RNA nuclease SfsA [Lacimicrobium alkaliphilum]|uniref:Sugar fermentation stimulation protein homolog n=1 Tax=Lacimicrobium alkaliphilum TaxID=1526571 RepID=A0ABQ1R602_9ALTE|nr:DNA/RNA nuclease SfsA [Lacimicrobium alkaliphilum]GGD59290.1 sugar fermentation stimulation protein [Lacimicrobium alkaliphilum]
MTFNPPLTSGTLIKRYKRFLADVQLDDGEVVTAHCANTGAMTGCAQPGCRVWLSYHEDPKRKLAYSWQLAEDPYGNWIGINTHNANRLVAEAWQSGRIPELAGYHKIRQEVRYGKEKSRIDLLLSDDQKPDCYVEVKSVTLLDKGMGYFPDTVTERGRKHLRELMKLPELGHRAVLLFCVQHSGITQVKAAGHIDKEYARLLDEAIACGVEVICYGCQFSAEKVELNQVLEFKC